MSLLAVRDVSLSFGGVKALDQVGFDLNRGEILGLIGPNGAGKTTLFNCISGVLTPDQGQIYFERRSILHLKPYQRARKGIARTFQNLQLWGSMTVLENCQLPVDALGRRNLLSDALGLPYSRHAERAAEERARAILHVLDLDDHAEKLAADLPVGLQRRVEVARALAMRPQLLLLDEPAAGLDAAETARLAELLQHVRDRFRLSMLLVDHDMSLVMKACDYLYVLDFGKLLARGRPEQVRDDPKVIAAYLGEAEAEPAAGAQEDTVVVAPLPAERAPAPKTAAAAAMVPATPAAEEVLEGAAVEITHKVVVPPGADAADQPHLLKVRGLAAGYGKLEVIRGIGLYVDEAEVVACIGSNGAGKTTTLRAISGIIKPSRGRVEFAGADLAGKRPEQIVSLGLIHIPQGRGLFPHLSVEDTLRLASYSGAAEGELDPAFEAFPQLSQRRRQLVATLSGGEQQMVAIARALLVRPRLLLIDEMSQGLAPTVVQQLFKVIGLFKREGVAVFLVEQFVDSALAVADRAYVIEQGTVVHEAPAAVLRADKSLIASSYLGKAAEEPVPAQRVAAGHRNGNGNGNGHHGPPELLEDMLLRLPAALKRRLEEEAARKGRPTPEVMLELLSGRRTK
jgi:ABC-type branched-subunit amino acid transport system ATPase component